MEGHESKYDSEPCAIVLTQGENVAVVCVRQLFRICLICAARQRSKNVLPQ